MTELFWPESGGTSSVGLPQASGTLGFTVHLSPLPHTPRWEWFVTNIPVGPLPGLVNGYADTDAAATDALCAALRFWRAHGYQTVDPPSVP